jgi:hypothetical protein
MVLPRAAARGADLGDILIASLLPPKLLQPPLLRLNLRAQLASLRRLHLSPRRTRQRPPTPLTTTKPTTRTKRAEQRNEPLLSAVAPVPSTYRARKSEAILRERARPAGFFLPPDYRCFLVQ